MNFETKKPWGKFDQYTLNEKTTVKIITVNPGEKLSLQSHKKRDEWWVIIDSGIVIEINGNEMIGLKDDLFKINKGIKHRMSNPLDVELRVLEISFGVFDEMDIIRYEDVYGRVK